MLYELRSYDFAPGNAVRYLDLFRREGLPLLTAHLPLAGYWQTEIGPLNRLHHLLAYQSLSERMARRAAFMADKIWTEGFLPRGMALVQRQESHLLQVVEGSPALDGLSPRKLEAEAAEQPLLGSAWFTLTFGPPTQHAASSGLIGRWGIVAGADAGLHVELSRFADPSEVPMTSTNPVEVCRPARFSPLA